MAGRLPITLPAASFDAAATRCPVQVRIDNHADLARHARHDASNLAFVTASGRPLAATIGLTKKIADDVTYTVASGPNGVRWRSADGSIDRTFLGAFRHQEGAADLISIDHLTGEMNVYRLAAPGLDPDDHNGVTIAVHPTSGVVFAFVVDHNTDPIRAFRSTVAGDAATMAEISSLLSAGAVDIAEAAYPQPRWCGDRLYLSWRDANSSGGYLRVISWTDDLGDTWAPRKILYSASGGDRPYSREEAFSATRMELITSRGLEREGGGTNRDLFHFYLDKATHNVYTTGGTLVGNIDTAPIDLDAATPILTQAAQGGFALRQHGVYRDTTTGEIAIAYKRVHREDQTDPWENDYGQIRWDGSAWSAEIFSAGNETVYGPTTDQYEGYLPGLEQSPTSLNECLAAVHNPLDRTYEIRRFTRTAPGVWTSVALTSAHTDETIRPVYVPNHHPDLEILYLAGSYEKFDTAATSMSLCGWPNVARSASLRALVEVDHDGSTDQTIYLVASNTTETRQPALADSLYATPGNVGRRTLAKQSSAIVGPDGTTGSMHALSGLTAVFAATFSGNTLQDRTILGAYGQVSGDNLWQARWSNDATARLEIVLNRGAADPADILLVTDIGLTSGQSYGCAFTWDGAPASNNTRAAIGGVLSAVADTAQGTLRNPSTSPRFRTGIRATAGYADNVQVFGVIDAVVVLPEARSTDWLRMASLGCGPAAYTLGAFMETGAPADSIAQQVRAELATELARLDAAVSTRATPATVRTELTTELARIDAPISEAGADQLVLQPTIVQEGADVRVTYRLRRNGQLLPFANVTQFTSAINLRNEPPVMAVGNQTYGGGSSYAGDEWVRVYPNLNLADYPSYDLMFTWVGDNAPASALIAGPFYPIAQQGPPAGGPIALASVFPGFLSRVPTRLDGQIRGDRVWVAKHPEERVCGWNFAPLGENILLESAAPPTSSDPSVVTVSTAPETGYGITQQRAIVRCLPTSGATAGAQAIIAMEVTLQGGGTLILENVWETAP